MVLTGTDALPLDTIRASLQVATRQVLHLSNGGSEKFLPWN